MLESNSMAVCWLCWYGRGYVPHYTKNEWNAAVGEDLEHVQEKNNLKDSYTLLLLCKLMLLSVIYDIKKFCSVRHRHNYHLGSRGDCLGKILRLWPWLFFLHIDAYNQPLSL